MKQDGVYCFQQKGAMERKKLHCALFWFSGKGVLLPGKVWLKVCLM